MVRVRLDPESASTGWERSSNEPIELRFATPAEARRAAGLLMAAADLAELPEGAGMKVAASKFDDMPLSEYIRRLEDAARFLWAQIPAVDRDLLVESVPVLVDFVHAVPDRPVNEWLKELA